MKAGLTMQLNWRTPTFLLGVLSTAACGREHGPSSRSADAPPPIHLETSPAGESTRLRLIAAPGVEISALLRPALVLPDGSVLRFDGPRRPPDSTYFAEAPTALLAGRDRRVSGTLHASVCLQSERVCRSIRLAL